MPTLLTSKGIRFRFYSSDKNEPRHVHAVQGRKKAKIWLHDLSLNYNRGFTSREMMNVHSIVEENQKLFTEAWDAFFNRA